jgi:hypothetical protein
MPLLGHLLLLVPSVLDVDVDPPSRVRFSEHFSPPERLGAVGEDGGPAVLVFEGPFVAGVLVGEDAVTVGVFHISSLASLVDMLPSLGLHTRYQPRDG